MADKRSREALFAFLDYLANKGLMAKGTVKSRKASAGKLLGILSDEEAADVTNLDLGEVMTRFHNLHGQKYTGASLNTYLSRTRSAINDFEAYLQNPLAFKPNVQPRDRKTSGESTKPNSNKKTGVRNATVTLVPAQSFSAPPSSSILPIPIRADVTVHIQGLPFDLTEAEANKIANVIRAMANPA